MGQIAVTDARGLFTKMLIDVYKEKPMVFSFLRSFFPTVESETKEVSIQVKRGKELVAVDVIRGSEGNANEFGRSSEKVIVPPYYREFFNATDLDFYDQLFGGARTEVDEKTFAGWLQKVAEKISDLRDKIERAYEVQCAQVLSDGIVQLKNGDNIDFKRKSTALVDLGGGNYWAAASAKAIDSIEDGCIHMRTKGKSQGGIVNAILGTTALRDLKANDQFKEIANFRRVALVDMRMPQRMADGGVLHGQIDAGAWVVNLWTYPEYYDTKSATNIPYIDPKKMILVPEKPNFKLAFGAVPMIVRDKGNSEVPSFVQQTRAAYVVGNRIDDKGDKHVFDIKSAGIAVPTAVDQIYTAQVVA